jgi:hypothetical protein
LRITRDELGRRQADDRQADHHRLDDREAEAGPADRVEEEAVRGHHVPAGGRFDDLAAARRRLGLSMPYSVSGTARRASR